jgi:glycosyltransferase involved in cell wall biosynthesis
LETIIDSVIRDPLVSDQLFVLFLMVAFFFTVDGLKILVEIHGRARVRDFASSPDDVTAVVPCHNSASVIRQTIEDLLHVLSPDRIIVVDDASTDDTAEIARSMGVRVFQFKKNKGKVSAINLGIFRVKTRYTLLIDDDTRLGASRLPTSLLEEGYSAVAFNVLPSRRARELVNGTNFVSCLQRYEYSKSMEIGKRFQDATLSVSCISGAVGLFLTERLNRQHHTHSTIFAGEDLERTLKDLLRGGQVAFVNEMVWTVAPDNWRDLTRQRLFSWYPGFYRNLSTFGRVLFASKMPWRLRFEMLYNVYVIFSDPVKVYSFAALLVYRRWEYLVGLYGIYLVMELYPFGVVEKKLPVVRYYLLGFLAYPIYGVYNTFLRFLAIFIWAWHRIVTRKMRPKGRPEDRIE